MKKRDALDRQIRKIVPSTAKLSYHPLFRVVGNLISSLPRLFFPELADLPPNHLRVRVGVGNKIFFNQLYHLQLPVNFWLNAFATGLCESRSNIVDIGCGCGRYAAVLANYSFTDGDHYQGTYSGIDIDRELIDFCQGRFNPQHFKFFLSPHESRTYSPAAAIVSAEPKYYALPLADESQDFVFSTSLFTHLLEREMVNYLQESRRVLRAGASMQMYVFCLDHMQAILGGRWNFSHQIGNAFVENIKLPEAAVAYRSDFLLRASREAGFAVAELFPVEGQSILRCRK